MPNNTIFIQEGSYDNLINNFNKNLEDIKLYYKSELHQVSDVYNKTYDNIFEEYKELTVNIKESLIKNKNDLNHKLETYNKVYPLIEKEYTFNKKNIIDQNLENEHLIKNINKNNQDNEIKNSTTEYNNKVTITKNGFTKNQDELNKNIEKINNDTNTMLLLLDNNFKLETEKLRNIHTTNLKKINEKYNKLFQEQESIYLKELEPIRKEAIRDNITIELLTKENNRIKTEFSTKINEELEGINKKVEIEIHNIYDSKIKLVKDEIEKSNISYQASKKDTVGLINSLSDNTITNDNIEQDLIDDIKTLNNLLEENKINQKKFLDNNKKNISDYHSNLEQIKSDKLLETKELNNIVDYEINEEVTNIIKELDLIHNKNKRKIEEEINEVIQVYNDSLINLKEEISSVEVELVNTNNILTDTNNKLKKSEDILSKIDNNSIDELIKQEMNEEHMILLENKNNFIDSYEMYAKNKILEFDINRNNEIEEYDNIKNQFISKDEELSKDIIKIEEGILVETKNLDNIELEKNNISDKINKLNENYIEDQKNLNLIVEDLVKESMKTYNEEYDNKVNELNNEYEKDLENINNRKNELSGEINKIEVGDNNALSDRLELKMVEINDTNKILENKKEELNVNLKNIEDNKEEEYSQLLEIENINNAQTKLENLTKIEEMELTKSEYYSTLNKGGLSQEETITILYKITLLEETVTSFKKINEDLSNNFNINMDSLDTKYDNLKQELNNKYSKDIEELESIISLYNTEYSKLKEDVMLLDENNKIIESIKTTLEILEAEKENINNNFNTKLTILNQNKEVLEKATYSEEYNKLKNIMDIENTKVLNNHIENLNIKDIEYTKTFDILETMKKDIEIITSKINASQLFLNEYDKNKKEIIDKYNKSKAEVMKLSEDNLKINDMTYNEQYNILLETTKNRLSKPTILEEIKQYESEILEKTKEIIQLHNKLETSNNKLNESNKVNNNDVIKELNNNIIFSDAIHKEKINNINKSVEDMKKDKLKIYLDNVDIKYLDIEKNINLKNEEMFNKIKVFDNNVKIYTDELYNKNNLLKKVINVHNNEETNKEEEIKKIMNDVETKFNNDQTRLEKELEDINKKIKVEISKNIELSRAKKIKEFEIEYDMIKKVSDIEGSINEINKTNKEKEEYLNNRDSIAKSELKSNQTLEEEILNKENNKEKEERITHYNDKKNETRKTQNDKLNNTKMELEELVTEYNDTIKNINTEHNNNLSKIKKEYETVIKTNLSNLELESNRKLDNVEDKFILDTSKYFVNYDKELKELEKNNKDEVNNITNIKDKKLEKSYQTFEENKQKLETKLEKDLEAIKKNMEISLKEKKIE